MTTRTEGYINGMHITIIDSDGRKNDEKDKPKPEREPLSETSIREKYGFDIACMVEHFNSLLKGVPLAATCLPLTEVSIFYRIYEGVLLCAIANLIKPDSVDETSVTVKRELLDDSPEGEIRKRENRNIGITALRTLGIFMDKETSENIKIEYPFDMTGLLVQMLRLATIGQMHFQNFEVLVHLFDDWSETEEVSAILATDREKMLLIWINHQIEKGGIQVTDFGETLADSKVYSILLETVAPADKKSSITTWAEIKNEADLTKRAEIVIANAEKLGIVGVLKPEHIATAGKLNINDPKGLHNTVLNIVFLYRIFLAYPKIDAPKMKDKPVAEANKAAAVNPEQQIKDSSCKHGATEETLIRWLNSFGPSSPVVSLKSDLCNGRVLLEVWDAMIPGSVPWKQVKLQHYEMAGKRKFNCMANCDIAIKIGEKNGISRNVCSSGNIITGDTKYIASLVFLMMRLHAQLTRKGIIGDSKKVAELDDSGLVKWFNENMEKYGSTFRLKSLEDPNLKNTNALGFFGERVLVENNLLSSGPADFPRKPMVTAKSGNAVDSNLDNAGADGNAVKAAQDEAGANNSGGGSWLFNSVEPVASDPALLTKFSVTAILMFNKAGVIVYASKLGPETDSVVYQSILMELNALSVKTN